MDRYLTLVIMPQTESELKVKATMPYLQIPNACVKIGSFQSFF